MKFTFWESDGKKSSSDNSWYELCTHVTNAPLHSPNSHLLPQYFLCWIRYVMEEVQRNLSWKRQPYLFWFGLIPAKWTNHGNFKNAAISPRKIAHAWWACALILPLCPVSPFASAQMFCACQDDLRNPDFLRTVATNSKVFLRGLWLCEKRRS